MAKKKAVGRPKKPPSEVRSVDIRIPVTPKEKQLVQDAAKKSEGRGELAEWARSVLLREAGKILGK